MDNLDNIKQKSERKNQRSFFTFFIFLMISTAAWFLVKLSEDYVTQTTFRLQFTEVPAEKWISSDEQRLKMSLNIDGFHTLRYKMIREPYRFVTIPLDEVSYHQENGNIYSFSSQYVAEKVAERIGISTTDIAINDANVYFTMDELKSKVVPIVFRSDIKLQRQYGFYGIPTIDPASVTIYGPEEIIDTVRAVRTEMVSKVNVSEGFSESVGLDMLDGRIRSNTKEVRVTVQVEKYTEKDVEVPIKVTDSLKLRFFPETMSVKCLVAMRDYATITPEDFSVAVDRQQLRAMQPLLDVRLTTWPNTVQILSTRPDKVEYLIVQ
ncbi:MAG: YbbR-like domain-containing protein [Bacteroidales bacterium]|nr:YbbR-like domain-containing protein [Bacteroidales bacterium]